MEAVVAQFVGRFPPNRPTDRARVANLAQHFQKHMHLVTGKIGITRGAEVLLGFRLQVTSATRDATGKHR